MSADASTAAAASGLKAQSTASKEAWVLTQKKTFTKWSNNSLNKKSLPPIKDAQTDFEDGVMLINLIHALYQVPIPKYNKSPKGRINKLDNINISLQMIEQQKIKTNFLKNTHLIDHDEKMILGMLWAIILHHSIAGISEDDLSAKEGLLLWCRKKTVGYKGVDPPTITNFSTNWRSGLAFCALIHKHRPDLIDYESLDATDAAGNLELAFSTAEKLGIARLLDVEDCNTEKPDERSVMTQVSEYFHFFASFDKRDRAARRAAKFLQFTKSILAMQNDYDTRARSLLSWVEETKTRFDTAPQGESLQEALAVNDALRSFVLNEKPTKSADRLDLEALYAEIQTQLRINKRASYAEPTEVSSDALESAFNELWQSEKAHGKAARENRNKFITKEESKISAEQLAEFHESFEHFNVRKDEGLDDKEFKAALSALGVSVKTDAEATALFQRVGKGASKISEENFTLYMTELNEDKDSVEQLIESFKALANGSESISEKELQFGEFSAEDAAHLASLMPQHESGSGRDYSKFVEQSFA